MSVPVLLTKSGVLFWLKRTRPCVCNFTRARNVVVSFPCSCAAASSDSGAPTQELTCGQLATSRSQQTPTATARRWSWPSDACEADQREIERMRSKWAKISIVPPVRGKLGDDNRSVIALAHVRDSRVRDHVDNVKREARNHPRGSVAMMRAQLREHIANATLRGRVRWLVRKAVTMKRIGILVLALLYVSVGSSPSQSALAQEPALRLELKQTHTSCELLGLGAIETVPYNFPGADAEATARYRSLLNPGIVEQNLVAGEHSAIPAILGGDFGAPFPHSDGRMYFTFGDAWFESSARGSGCPTQNGNCRPRVENDDLLLSSTVSASSSCVALEAPTVDSSTDVLPLTWDGPANAGGQPLGTAVPGPGFSTGRFMFVLRAADAPMCSAALPDCSAANGIVGDVCRPDSTGVHRCYFGPCGDDPNSPCALRFNPNRLLVHVHGSDFTEPTVGVHVASEHVFSAYRGHFSAVTFSSEVDFATASGRVWVVGRDSFWGAPGLTMSPYLMYHPVVEGRLEEPMFFAGMKGHEPVFSPTASDAVPLYEEQAILTQHTSFMFEPELEGGAWIMIYGGHAQPVQRRNIGLFLQPVVDDIFHARQAGVYVRVAKNVWGPWSPPETLFNPFERGQGGYCEQMYFEDHQEKSGFGCPEELAAHNAELNRAPGLGSAGEYGAALVPGASELTDGSLRLRWLLSTWNPYRVLMQESELLVRSTVTPL